MLLAGDMHIPHRVPDVADKFRKILAPNKMQHVLCTGNLTSREQQDFLRALAPRMHLVRGDFDDDGEGAEQTGARALSQSAAARHTIVQLARCPDSRTPHPAVPPPR